MEVGGSPSPSGSRANVAPGQPTLATLLDDLGPASLRALLLPHGGDVALGELVIHDTRQPQRMGRGAVVLGVGVDAGAEEADALVRRAAAEGSAAVVLKLADAAPPRLLRACEQARVALLAALPSADWSRLYAQLHAATARPFERPAPRRRGRLVRQLLGGEHISAPDGGELGGPAAVVAFQLAGGDAGASASLGQQLSERVARAYERTGQRVDSAALGGVIYALALGPPAAREALVHRTRAVLAEAGRNGIVLRRAAIGGTAERPDGIRESRWEADRVLELGHRVAPASSVVHVDEVRAHLLLAQLAEVCGDRRLRLPGLEALRAHDERHDTRHVETLRAFLEAPADVAGAAARAGVPPSDLHASLGELGALGELDLGDPTQRLALQILLRLDRGRSGA